MKKYITPEGLRTKTEQNMIIVGYTQDKFEILKIVCTILAHTVKGRGAP